MESRQALSSGNSGQMVSRRTFLRGATAVLAQCAIQTHGKVLAAPSMERDVSRPSSSKPNFIIVLTDDLDQETCSPDYMPYLQQYMVQEGLTFTTFAANASLCSPSRASLLRGQYVHNHGVRSNDARIGGFAELYRRGIESSTLATELKAAGYRTAFLGKYMNGYPLYTAPTYIPPGWDEWCALCATPQYYDYQMNVNGTLVQFGTSKSDYLTDVLSLRATECISQAASAQVPFFLLIAPYAPHGPSTPARRHLTMFADEIAPRTPSFNEEDVSSKPAYIRDSSMLTEEEILRLDKIRRNRLCCIQAVDEMIRDLFEALTSMGLDDNTYVIFASDNGILLGQHRIPSRKAVPYEEATIVPCIIRGPGISRADRSDKLVGIVDIMPTILDLAGCMIPSYVDGRSLRLFLHGEDCPDWRQVFLIENEASDEEILFGIPLYYGLRTTNLKYVEYATGERELYDLDLDPYELNNRYTNTPMATKNMLSCWLQGIQTSAGAALREQELYHIWLPVTGATR